MIIIIIRIVLFLYKQTRWGEQGEKLRKFQIVDKILRKKDLQKSVNMKRLLGTVFVFSPTLDDKSILVAVALTLPYTTTSAGLICILQAGQT